MSVLGSPNSADAPQQPVSFDQMNAAMAAMETRMFQMVSEMVGGDASAGSGESPLGVRNSQMTSLRPFEVYYEYQGKGGQYKMFLPKNSIIIGKTDVTPDKGPTIEEGNTYYLHVRLAEPCFDGGDSAKFAVIDSNASSASHDLTIPVVKMSKDMGVEEQYLTSALVLCPHYHEPVFEPAYGSDGKLTGQVYRPYLIAGRRVIKASGTIGSNSTWGVEVNHESDSVTAIIKSIGSPEQANSDKKKTIIPLYKIGSAGNIIEDYRGMPCVPLYDPKST